MRSFRRTLEFLAPYRWRVFAAVMLTLLVTALSIVPPRIFEYAVDKGIKPSLETSKQLQALPPPVSPDEVQKKAQLEQRLHELRSNEGPNVVLVGCVTLLVVVCLRSFLNFLLSVTATTVGQRFCFDLRFATWQHLQRLSMAYHKQHQTGKIMSRATADIELIQGLIQGSLVTFISDIVTLCGVLGMLFYLEWRIAAIILVLIPFYVISYLAFLKRIREIRQEQRRLWDVMVGMLAEKIAGIAVVKAFVRERGETSAFMHAVRDKFRIDVRQMHLNRQLALISGVISAIGTGVVYSYGGTLVQQGDITVGRLIAITFYIGYVFQPAVRVVDFNTALQWAIAAMDRVFQTLDTRPEIDDAPGAVPLPPLERDIVFDGVDFTYQDGDQGLHDVNLRVKAGEIIGVVGPSGAGKTTLMNLLMRFYDPTSGRVTIDGHDLRDVRIDSIRSQLSMVAQENMVFSVSIMENVKYGARGATDAQVIAACKTAEMHEFFESLDDGYETRIGEHGIKLSGGQRQRLALARALVTDPRVLILDDVTSALDGETEAKVRESLKHVMQGRTTFIIAHRLASVVDADRIIVLDKGRIVDVGTHAELVDRQGIYQGMYQEQFRSALEAGA